MKNISFIFISLLLMALLLYHAFEADKKLELKDKRIKELEFQVWSLKLDKHFDSIVDYNVNAFRRKLDSTLHARR